MKRLPAILAGALLPCLLTFLPSALAQPAATPPAASAALDDPLINLSAEGIAKLVSPQAGSEKQVTVARSKDPAAPGVVVTIAPGKQGYPGVNIKPGGAEKWDLSAHGHVDARVVNTGSKPLAIALRLDNAGDWHEGPSNTEQITIKPGETGTANVIFGYSYGRKKAYALKPEAVVNILVFTTKASEEKSFRIESIVAAGPAGEKPPLDPKSVRVNPKEGMILGAGAASDVMVEVGPNTTRWEVARAGSPLPDVSLKFETTGGAKVAMEGSTARAVFPAGKGEQAVLIKPMTGSWDLRNWTEVQLKVKNDGKTPLTPSVVIKSIGGATRMVTFSEPLTPGAEKEVLVSFLAAAPGVAVTPVKPGYYAIEPGTGTTFCSDGVGPIQITAKHDGEASLLVESIIASTSIAEIPDWLGKRPPVAGDWEKTFEEEFDGSTIDQKKWNIYGENFWDKRTHWSKDNLILGDGMMKMHFEKKHGCHNDDPKSMLALTNPKTSESDYACGFLDTYGKWVQRYGYFEARVKLPVTPGLWPTFWLMPDRGAEVGPQWKRADTGNGGMEFDIMEHLTRWGPHRYNIANHWDGYGKTHASNGTTCNYALPDKDGFITCGLLWSPGSLVYYCNGQEMLRWENSRISAFPANIILEVTTGGWDNNALDDKQLPVDYVIDYVRCWQRKDLASAVDGFKTAANHEAKPETKAEAK